MNNRRLVLTLSVLVATVMVFSSFTILAEMAPQSSAAQGSSNVSGTPGSMQAASLAQQGANILNSLQGKGIPSNYIYMPSFRMPSISNGNISGPSYTSAPAPMGIGTYGFSNNSGVIDRYTLNTPSFMGSVTFNNFSTFYPLDDGPNSVTVQLNSILSNVTLFGVSNYTFWNQNVLFYSARTNTVQFLDNIWNFSSPQFVMTPNVFSSYGGNLVAPEFYYAIGPAFSVTYPFTVTFYLNSTVMNGDNTVFFNFTLSDASGSVSGSYDQVQFNSTYGMPAGYSAPQANYYVTSSELTPTGFIPYDSEIDLGGPGGGSTAMVYAINATMNLKYLNGADQYANVPSAYNVGSETGETSTGIAETWTPNGVAQLSAGPSFVYGMWNVSQVNTFQHFSGSVNPPNAFMFVSPGTVFSTTLSSWSPLSEAGTYSFSLPSGSYSTSILMSNRDPVSGMLMPGSPQSTNMNVDFSQGVYTPLYAFGNSQLQFISFWGHGTKHSPYMIYNNPSPSGYLDPIFSTFNDYMFPQFSGVLLHGTDAYVVMQNMPSLSVQYTLSGQTAFLSHYGVEYTTNQIGYVLYQAQNVMLTHSAISGWFANTLTTFPVANVLLWNSQNDQIAYNTFTTMDSSMLIYNMHGQKGGNSVYGNAFVQDSNLNLTRYAGIAIDTSFGTNPYGPVGLTMYSSFNSINGNFFAVFDTAVSPFYSIYSGLYAQYLNNWNGNFWWNYVPQNPGHGHEHDDHGYHGSYSGHGQNLYNNSGLISYGGDHHPITFRGYNPGAFYYMVTNFLRN